jgi:hypothetical protein
LLIVLSPSKVVQQDIAEYHQSFKSRNKEYEDFLEKNSGGNENLEPRCT